jgi:hypothetical protein
METKRYLYMICGIGVAVMGMNAARSGIPGPATLTLFLLPLAGLVILIGVDMWNFVLSQRTE